MPLRDAVPVFRSVSHVYTADVAFSHVKLSPSFSEFFFFFHATSN